MWNKRVGSSPTPCFPVLPEQLIFITSIVLPLLWCTGAWLGSKGVSTFQQMPKGVVNISVWN